MNGIALLVALSALGIDHTWRQTEDGRVEYVLEVEPTVLKALAEGEEINSELPATVKRVDRICVRVGSGSLKTLTKTPPDWPQLEQPREQRAAGQSVPLSIYVQAKGDAFESYDLAHGWQPARQGGSTYLVQIDPELLGLLQPGDEIYSALNSEAGTIRAFKITAGREQLPQETAGSPVVRATQLQTPNPQASSAAADVPPYTDLTGGSSVYGGAAQGDASSGTGQTNTGGSGFPATTPPRWSLNDAQVADPQDESLAGQPATTLQPPANPLLEAPSFDRNQFTRPAERTGTPRTGTSRAPRSPSGNATETTPLPRGMNNSPRGSYVDDGYDTESDLDGRVASRTTAARASLQEELPPRSTSPRTTATAEKEPNLPAWPLFFTVCALFLSIGGNLYLGWTAAEFYSRYRLAVERLRSASR